MYCMYIVNQLFIHNKSLGIKDFSKVTEKVKSKEFLAFASASRQALKLQGQLSPPDQQRAQQPCDSGKEFSYTTHKFIMSLFFPPFEMAEDVLSSFAHFK